MTGTPDLRPRVVRRNSEPDRRLSLGLIEVGRFTALDDRNPGVCAEDPKSELLGSSDRTVSVYRNSFPRIEQAYRSRGSDRASTRYDIFLAATQQ